MLERVFYGWRLVATAICFAVFGLGSLLLGLVFPILHLFIWHRQHRIAVARAVIHRIFQIFVRLMVRLGLLRFEMHGQQRLNRRGLLILANHPTLIDTVLLMSCVKRADCIVKADLQANLFLRGAMNAAGYIFNNHGDNLINDCIQSLQSGNNLIVFPEGTRTPPDDQINLKRGAAHIAVRAPCNVTPVIITCSPKTLGKGEKWWQVPSCKVTFRIEVQEDIEVEPFIHQNEHKTCAARHLTTYLHAYFSERTQHHA